MVSFGTGTQQKTISWPLTIHPFMVHLVGAGSFYHPLWTTYHQLRMEVIASVLFCAPSLWTHLVRRPYAPFITYSRLTSHDRFKPVPNPKRPLPFPFYNCYVGSLFVLSSESSSMLAMNLGSIICRGKCKETKSSLVKLLWLTQSRS